MTTFVQDFAREHGLMTGADLPPPIGKFKEPHETIRKRQTKEWQEAFAALDPSALCMVATQYALSITLWDRGSVVDRLGHNRGVRPVKFARSDAWKDTITANYNKSPVHEQGVVMRLWCRHRIDRDRVYAIADTLLADIAERDGSGKELHGEFVDAGPEFDVPVFMRAVCEACMQQGIVVWDDMAVQRICDETTRRIEAQMATGKGLRDRARATELAVEKVLAARGEG